MQSIEVHLVLLVIGKTKPLPASVNNVQATNNQAKKIIENSRIESMQEKDRIEHLIEMEKEKLLEPHINLK
jgi:hypothetical protein